MFFLGKGLGVDLSFRSGAEAPSISGRDVGLAEAVPLLRNQVDPFFGDCFGDDSAEFFG